MGAVNGPGSTEREAGSLSEERERGTAACCGMALELVHPQKRARHSRPRLAVPRSPFPLQAPVPRAKSPRQQFGEHGHADKDAVADLLENPRLGAVSHV